MKKKLLIWCYSIVFSLIQIYSAQACKFAVISDARVRALDAALEFIASQNVDFIIIPGDYYYDKQDYYSHFVKFGFKVKPEKQPDKQNVYFVLGNHDAPPYGDVGFINLIAPFYPKNGPEKAPQGTIFSFNRNNCHFVVTNQYWNYPEGGYTSDQLKWIKQDLAASDKAFKFVFGHEPAFPLYRHIGDSLDANPTQRNLFWQILAENNVQAFFCGHTHNLSHVLDKGIYQIDNGRIKPSTVCVTIVDVGNEKATIRSYKQNKFSIELDMIWGISTVPVLQIDPVIETDIDLKAAAENIDTVKVLYSAKTGPKLFKTGCFISTIFSPTYSE